VKTQRFAMSVTLSWVQWSEACCDSPPNKGHTVGSHTSYHKEGRQHIVASLTSTGSIF
jgi:hypothetical protein